MNRNQPPMILVTGKEHKKRISTGKEYWETHTFKYQIGYAPVYKVGVPLTKISARSLYWEPEIEDDEE